MSLSRIVYTHSSVEIGPSGALLSARTAQSATITFNVPRENVNVFGRTGQVDRPQLDATDATFEFSMIPEDSGASIMVFTHSVLDGWINDSLANSPTYTNTAVAQAAGLGQTLENLIGSLSAEATVGAMATMTISLTGTPSTTAVPAAASSPDATAISLVTATDVEVDAGFGIDCAQSAAVAWDLPIETILCLKGDPTDVADVHTYGNPPGTASFTIEGLDDGLAYTASAASLASTDLKIGNYKYTLTSGRVDSQTNSLAVGDAFGTFNYVIAGTADGFTIGAP